MSTFTIDNDDTVVPEEEKECPYCGRMVVSYALYCIYCGKRIDNKEYPNSGKTVDVDANFCSVCGTMLDCDAVVQQNSVAYQYVDLGLPSGTLWADRNIGATSPEDVGDDYAWGEISPKDEYTWRSYTYHDKPETLPSSHDAATYNLGSDWCLPTKDQFDELWKNCEWTRRGNVYKATSKKNGNSILFPAANGNGYYWSSSLDTDNPKFAWLLYFHSGHVRVSSYDRYYGQLVRAVRCKINPCVSKSQVVDLLFDNKKMSTFTIENDDDIEPTEEKECPYCGSMVVSYASYCTYCGKRIDRRQYPQCGKPMEENSSLCTSCGTRLDSGAVAQSKSVTHQYIDLGLPSGTLWADRNIGAKSPEDTGDYFAWGEISPKDGEYTKDTYIYRNNPKQLPLSNDVAIQKLGNDWCMPTKKQFEELFQYCTWTWTGEWYEVKSKQNDNLICLPAAGAKRPTREDEGLSGSYWSSSLNEGLPDCAWYLFFDSINHVMYRSFRHCGFSVRAVRRRNFQ